MSLRDTKLDELRAVLDAAFAGEVTLGSADVRRLISSWELMRRVAGARALAASWEAAHGPLPPAAAKRPRRR